MKLEAFLKKNMKRLTRLERELDKLFEGTDTYTVLTIEERIHRHTILPPKIEIMAYVSKPGKWYSLENFANMAALITQIKHDVKEVQAK